MKNTTIIIGLILGAVCGFAGSNVTPGITQNTLWEISCLSFVVAAALLAARYTRAGHDKAGVGFTLFAIGSAVMTTGLAANNGTNPAAFAAGTAIYLPALLFISVPKNFPVWSRVTGMLSAIAFGVSAFSIFTGTTVSMTGNTITMAAYALQTIALVGWIVVTARDTVPATNPA